MDCNFTNHSRASTSTNTIPTSGPIVSPIAVKSSDSHEYAAEPLRGRTLPLPNLVKEYDSLEQPGPSRTPAARNTVNRLMRLGASWGVWVGLRASVTEVGGLGSSRDYSWGDFLMASE